jgi:hypothetical protein
MARSLGVPDPYARLSGADLARCREAARSDFEAAVRGLAAAVADVRRARSSRERLEAAYGIFRSSGQAIAASMRYLRLSAHQDADAGATPIASAREVRRSARSSAGTT